jgi:uncharacterized membrane protein YbhN (UPF0104 family)
MSKSAQPLEDLVMSESTDDLATKSSLKKLLCLLRLLIAFALLTYVLLRYDAASVFRSLKDLHVHWLVPGWALLYVGFLLRSLRWRSILYSYGRKDSVLRLFSLYIEASFFNLFFPGFVAGDISRAARTSTKGKQSLEALFAVFFERFSGLFIVSVYVGCIALWGGYGSLGGILPNVILIAVAMVLTVFLLLLHVRCVQYIVWFFPSFLARRVEKAAEKLQYTIKTVMLYPTLLCQITSLSVLLIFSMVGAAYFISRAINFPVPFGVLLAYVPLTAFINNLPISIAGLGVRENVYVFFYSTLGFLPADIIAFALTFSGLGLVLRFSGGLLFLLRSALPNLKSKYTKNMSFKRVEPVKR